MLRGSSSLHRETRCKLQALLPQCSPGLIPSPQLFLSFVLLPVLPTAVPVVRFGIPASPTSGRTAGDAVSRSPASSVRSPHRAKQAARAAKGFLVDSRRPDYAAPG